MRGLSTLPSRRGATVGTLGPIHVRPPRRNIGAPRRAGRLARARRAAAELPPDAVEQIAHRVVELLRLEGQTIDGSPASGPELLNAAEARPALRAHPHVGIRKRGPTRRDPAERRTAATPALRPPSRGPSITPPRRAGPSDRAATAGSRTAPAHAHRRDPAAGL